MEPPRTGAGERALRELTALGPARIIYVAGDPASLARDGVHLTAAGYRLIEAQPVDMSPQTFRVETVALWVKRGLTRELAPMPLVVIYSYLVVKLEHAPRYSSGASVQF